MESIKVYVPNISSQSIGGGWTFLRNFKKSVGNFVQWAHNWQEADVVFITGITMVDKNEIHEASKAGKKIVLRVDNVPRKSRNKRNTPHERLRELADIADVVIYQSEWAKNYCYPLCGEGEIIYNGVDLDIFYPPNEKPKADNYLYAYHGKNELKGFWQAHYYYQKIHRRYQDEGRELPKFLFIYDFKREHLEMQQANYDFWNGEIFKHYDKIDDPKRMAELMRTCKYLIYPSIADAAPNLVLEARACGLEVIHYPAREFSGTEEMLDQQLDISLERMGREYISLFRLLLSEANL